MALRTNLIRTSKVIEKNPFNHFVPAQVAALLHEIRKFDLYEAKEAQLKARFKWLKVGDRVTKDFFKRLGPPIHSTQFKALKVNDDRLNDFLNIIQAFVTHLQGVFDSQPFIDAH